MSTRSVHLPLTILTSRSSCRCFFTNASTTTTATIAAATAMTESVRKHPVSRRTFMSTSSQRDISGNSIMEQNIRRKARNAPSTKSKMRMEVASTETPNDLGLLPETFVMPSGENLPSIFNNPRNRWRFEWKRVKSKFQNFIMLLVYRYGDSLRPRPSLELRQRKKIAREMYELMNQAIAEKDIATLRSICADGIFDSIRTRISWRDPEEHLHWSLASPSSSFTSSPGIIHRLLGKRHIKASVISDRAAPLPSPYSPTAGPRNRLRQMVVRLDSAQKLVRWRWKNENDVAKSITPLRNNTDENHITSISTNTSTEEDIKREILAEAANPEDPHQEQQQQQQQEKDVLNRIEILGTTGYPQPHQSTEYLVLQQQLTNGVQQPWTIWGNTEETSAEVLERWGRGHVDEDGERETNEGSGMRVGADGDSGAKMGA